MLKSIFTSNFRMHLAIIMLLCGLAHPAMAQSRNLNDVINRLKDDLATTSDSSATYARMGLLYLRLEDADNAEKAFQNAITLRPDLAIAHTGLGRVYQDLQNKPDKALSHFEKSIAIDTTDANTHDRLIKTLLQLEHTGGRARKTASQTIARFPDLPSPYLLLARAHQEEGSAHHATLYYYKNYLERNPDDNETAYDFAFALYEAKEYKDLEDITSRMQDPRALPLRAHALVKRRDHEGALTVFQRYIETLSKEEQSLYDDISYIGSKAEARAYRLASASDDKTQLERFLTRFWLQKTLSKPQAVHFAEPNTTAAFGMHAPILAKNGPGIAEAKFIFAMARPTIYPRRAVSMPLSRSTSNAFKNKEPMRFMVQTALKQIMLGPFIPFAPSKKGV